MLDKNTETAYNLWAQTIDRPAKWWFTGEISIYVDIGVRVKTTPDLACRNGYSDQVLEFIRFAREQIQRIEQVL